MRRQHNGALRGKTPRPQTHDRRNTWTAECRIVAGPDGGPAIPTWRGQERFRRDGHIELTAQVHEQQAVVAYSDALIDELRSADTIVLAVPMYNFGVPSTLRTYFDHVARAGVTFRYSSAGPEGLLAGRRAYVFVTRGGVYGGEHDTQAPYLRQFLGFIGIESEFVFAQGLAYGDESRRQSLANAREQIAGLMPVELAA